MVVAVVLDAAEERQVGVAHGIARLQVVAGFRLVQHERGHVERGEVEVEVGAESQFCGVRQVVRGRVVLGHGRRREHRHVDAVTPFKP